MTEPLHLAVSLDGAGYHEAAWRDPTSRPDELFSADYWVEHVRLAERGLLDLVSFEDAFGIQSQSPRKLDARTDQVRGRLEAVLLACRVAPTTRHIGLVPIATTTHTEPFHIASAISTLDWITTGRAGWQPRVSGRPADVALVGIRTAPAPAEAPGDRFAEATDAVDVVRRLWDSWEDDAIIKDVATGRFVDRDKLHYIDFAGKYFSVKGPSITPRPPQGQPVVAALAHAKPIYEFAVRSTDLVFITPQDDDSLRAILAEVAGLKVYADLYVTFSGIVDARSDALVFDGTPTELAELLLRWRQHGVDGVRLRPAVNATDLPIIVDEVVPPLQQAGRFRTAYTDGETLRTRLGLPVAENRYAKSR